MSGRLTDTQLISARMRMVDEQIARRGIYDQAVLAAMRTVPRHEFVRPEDLAQAYGDHPLSIGHDQTISQPYVVASMTQELGANKNSRILEIGTGCGYQTAILAEVAGLVYTIECIPELFRAAMSRLVKLGYNNVTGTVGDGSRGWSEHAPFDGILVAAAAAEVPDALVDQLAEPGRLIIPVGRHLLDQQLVLVKKSEGQVSQTALYGVRFVPLRTSES
ncbi:MAG: protein-L-isoaspartate(D-aspartate) O-methyltransferase [Candidatus Zixiibacteriota bacterium]